MKLPQVTSGRVVYSRTVQPAQYESKRAEVEFAFAVEDGEDPGQAAREAGELARREVHALLAAPEPAARPAKARRTRSDSWD